MSKAAYLDASQSVDARVTDLLPRMTLNEQLPQMGGVWSTSLLDERGTFSEPKARENLANGTGPLTRIGGATVLAPEASAALVNAIQRFLVEHTRLGVPAIVHEE